MSKNLNVSTKDGICFVEFVDRKILDEVTISEISKNLAALVEEHTPINLLLNFKNVEYLSSAVLGMLVAIQKQVKDGSGQLKLTDIRPKIFEVFEITRMNEMFEFHENAAAAKASFANG